MSETPSIENLLESLRDSSWETRLEAARLLRETRTEIVPPSLLAAIDDEDLAVRIAVVETLGNFSDLAVEEALLQALFDEEWEVQWAAMRSLGTFWKEPDLRKMGDKLPEKRIAGIEAMAKKPSEQLLPTLLASLDDELEEVQAATVRALAQLGHPKAIEPLRKMIRHAPRDLKALIAETLSQLGDEQVHMERHKYLLSCEQCNLQLPPSFLFKVAQWQEEPRYLCQFHFDEHSEKVLPFVGKLKPCKLCKTYWPKVESVEGACPECREKRYMSLAPVDEEDLFRCFRCQKTRSHKERFAASPPNEPLCSKCAHQISQLSANSPFYTRQAIQFMEHAFDEGLLLCERCRQFRPLEQIVKGHDFRDECLCSSCSR